jgi:hypothetical protein
MAKPFMSMGPATLVIVPGLFGELRRVRTHFYDKQEGPDD